MRHRPASHLRGAYAKPVQSVPREGTKLREVYDLFQANKGRVVEYRRENGSRSRIIDDLQDFYGLDLRNVRRGQWVLAGEWFGRVYQDYIAERLEAA